MDTKPVAYSFNRAVEVRPDFDDIVKLKSREDKSSNQQTKISKVITPDTFDNLDTQCALSIIRAITTTAKKYIYIFTDCLDPQVYDDGELCLSFKNFIDNGGQVVVLINNKAGFQKFAPAPQLYAKFHANKEFTFNFAIEAHKLKNFIVADDIMYRLEIEPDLHRAIASFDDSEFSIVLKEVHQKLCIVSNTNGIAKG
jgi:hypothetical protein